MRWQLLRQRADLLRRRMCRYEVRQRQLRQVRANMSNRNELLQRRLRFFGRELRLPGGANCVRRQQGRVLL